MNFKAILLDGKSANEQEVDLMIDRSSLTITRQDHSPILINENDITDILHFKDSITLKTFYNNTEIKLVIEDTNAINFLMQQNFLQKNVCSQQQKIQKLVALMAVVVLLLVGTYQSITPFSYWISRQLPIDVEMKIFGDIAKSYIEKKECRVENQEYIFQNMLDLLLANEEELKKHIKINIVHEQMQNAFALPGGQILLTKKLIDKANSPSELLGILAHEIEHIKQRHVLGEFVRSTLFVSTWAILFSDYTGFLVIDPQTLVQILNLSYSKRAETEADTGAIQRLQSANISTKGMVDFFKNLQDIDKIQSHIPSFLSSHPHPEERIKRFEDAIQPQATQGLTPQQLLMLQGDCVY